MSVLDRVRRTTPVLWSLGSRAGAAAGFALVNVLLARRMTTADFGVLAVATTVATFGAIAVSAGLNRTLLRNVAASLALDREHEVLADLQVARRILVWSIPAGVMLTAAGTWAFTDTTGDTARLLAITSALALSGGLVLLLSDVLRGLGEVRLANLTAGRNGGALALLLFAALLAASGSSTISVFTALGYNTVAVGVSLLALFVTFRRLEPRSVEQPPLADPVVRKALLVASVAFAGTQAAAFFSTQVDLLVGGRLLSPDDVGIYAGALRVMTIVALPLFAAQLVVIAKVSALHAQQRMAELERLVRRTATMLTVPAIVLLTPCVVFPSEVLTLLFGAEFASGGAVLAVLSVGQLVNVVTGLCGTVLSMTSHERLVLWVTLGGAAVSTGADVVGARVGGMVGLAVASAVTTSAMFVTLWVLAKRRTGLWTHAGWPKPVPTRTGADG